MVNQAIYGAPGEAVGPLLQAPGDPLRAWPRPTPALPPPALPGSGLGDPLAGTDDPTQRLRDQLRQRLLGGR